MKALDLFCGAGGSSMGLSQAGFDEIIGVDIHPQLEYPFKFLKGNVFDIAELYFDCDLIWASPPCQAYATIATNSYHPKDIVYPDLISQTRKLLFKSNKPFVIENVPVAPIRADLLLCGEMFDLKVIRHRIFEIEGFGVNLILHKAHRGKAKDGYYVSCVGNGGNSYTDKKCSTNTSHLRGYMHLSKLETWQFAMGIDWITNKKMLAEAVPPAYAKYIGEQFLRSQ